MQGCRGPGDLTNAALEWQAGGPGWRNRGQVGACPLEGLVRSVVPSENHLQLSRTRNNTAKTQQKLILSLASSSNIFFKFFLAILHASSRHLSLTG
jgi:hypothetical protein